MAKISYMDVYTYIFGAIALAFVIGVSCYVYKKESSLNENKTYAKAVVFEFEYGTKMKYYVNYMFYVKGKPYEGTSVYSRRKNSLSVGDTILIMYDSSDPENNKTYYDYK